LEAWRSDLGARGMADWRDELARWLAPFVERFGHKARRRMCPLYVAGLIGPGDRKSVGPMAERVAPGDYDRLHHFVSDGVWDEAPLERELALQADKLVGGAGAFLVIDDTTLPKKGTHSAPLTVDTLALALKEERAMCFPSSQCHRSRDGSPYCQLLGWRV
jgi:SRSO17 transposase